MKVDVLDCDFPRLTWKEFLTRYHDSWYLTADCWIPYEGEYIVRYGDTQGVLRFSDCLHNNITGAIVWDNHPAIITDFDEYMEFWVVYKWEDGRYKSCSSPVFFTEEEAWKWLINKKKED